MILLLRHAESEWNAEGRWQGRGDPALSARGRAAAGRAGTLLPAAPTVVASNLTRARETAEVIARGWGSASLTWVTPLLAERSVGPWEGLTRDEIELRWPRHLERGERPPGFESDESALRRLQEALAVIERDFRGSRVLCVTHGGLIHALEAWAGLPWARLENLVGRWVTLHDGVIALGKREGRAAAMPVSES